MSSLKSHACFSSVNHSKYNAHLSVRAVEFNSGISALQTFFKKNSGLSATPQPNNIFIFHFSSRITISSDPSLSISYTSDLIILFNHLTCSDISNLTKSFSLLFNTKGNH
jgi:hypothetical protein